MGINSSCSNCCMEKELYLGGRDSDDANPITGIEILLPKSSYARPVNSIIDMTYIVRKSYKEQKLTMGTLERRKSLKGNLLQAYYIFDLNAYYEGEWKDGFPHGQGRLLFDDGSLFEGTMNKGSIECEHGLYIFPNGDYYKGSIFGNKANGQGTLKYQEIFYVGQWTNNLPNGQGVETIAGCYKYIGQFKEGMKHGQGLFLWPQQGSYEGSFYANCFQGRGILKLKQYTYEGGFYRNKKQGFGRLRYSNMDYYQGQFSNDQKEGHGTFTWADQSSYTGSFHNDLQHGFGKFTSADNAIIQGEWNQGCPPDPN